MTDFEWNTTFNHVWDSYHNCISAYIHYRLPHDYETAEDCVQNVFLTFYYAKEKINNLEHIKAWLYRVADNYIKKEYCRMCKNPISAEPIDNISEKLIKDDIYIQIEGQDLKEVLIKHLTDSEKNQYMLFYEYELSMKQIAKRLDISVDAAKKRKERLKVRIAILLKELLT